MVKYILITTFLVGTVSASQAQYYYGSGSNSSSHSVQGYTRQDGTYVQPHYQTNPNNTRSDNYGTSGNYNPYTGSYGSRRSGY